MINDIYKNILIKFKVDDREIKRIQEGLSKGSTIPGGTSPMKNLPDSVRQILQMSREMDKVGVKMNKSFDSMAKAAKAIAGSYLKDAEKQLDQISRKAETRIKALERLQKMGASQETIQRMQARVDQSVGAAGDMLRDVRSARELTGNGMPGRVAGIFGINPQLMGAGAIMAGTRVPGQIAGMYQSALTTSAAAAGSIGQELVRRRIDASQGNLLDSIMNVNNRQDMKAKAWADKQTSAETVKKVGSGVLGAVAAGAGGYAGAVGGAALGTMILPGVGTVIGGVLGGLGGSSYGMGMMGESYNYFGAGGKEKFRLQKFQEGRQNLQAQSIDPYLYQQFRDRSPGYARANRLLQFNSEQANQFRQNAFGRMMDAQEALDVATGLRPQFGAANAVTLSGAVQNARITTGFDTQTLTGMIATQAKFGAGGTKEASNNLEKIMTLSFSKGITDSGLVEKMTELVGAFQAAQTTTTDSGRVAAQILSGVTPGQEGDIRSIEAAARAQTRIADIYQEGGYRGFKKRTMAADISGQLGLTGAEAIDFQMALSGKDMEEGRKLIERYGKGKDPSSISKILETYETFGERELVTTPGGREAMKKIRAKQERGEPVTDADMAAVQTSIEASGTMKRGEDASALARRAVYGSKTEITTEGQEARAKAAGQAAAEIFGTSGATAESRQEAAIITGRGQVEKDVTTNIRNQMDDVMKLYATQKEMSQKFGENVGLTADSAAALTEALDNLIAAINKKTAALGGRPATSRAGQ